MGTWVTDPATGMQKWQPAITGYTVINGEYGGIEVPMYDSPPAPGPAAALANTISTPQGGFVQLGDGYYYPNTEQNEFGGYNYDTSRRMTAEQVMAIPGAQFQQLGPAQETDGMFGSDFWGALATMAGFAGGMSGLGSLLGGSASSVGSVLPSMGLDDLAASSISGSPASSGLSWLGNAGLSSIPEAVGSLPAAGSAAGGMLSTGAFNPGAVMDAGAAASYNPGAVLDAATSAAASGAGGAASLIPGFTNAQLVSGGLSLVGGLLSGQAAQEGAQQSANAQLEAARIAADAAKFKPVGVTTRFGQSQFTKDAQGNVTGAGYTMPADIRAMQDSLLGAAPGMLNQFTNSVATTAPMGTAAQRAMSLGNQYLATDPLAQAQKYYDDQQAVMATQRARDQAGMLTGEFNRGTYGLATGATGQMGAANPRLEALYNAQRQQDLGLAAAATQGGMDYAKFGAGMVGTGGDLLKGMYGTQTASYSPFQTALGGAQTIEGLGQNALDLSINMGKIASPAQSGQLLAQGMLGAAQTMQPANSYSPWGALLTGAGNTVQNMAQPQQGTSWYDPSKYRLTPI